MTLSARHGSSLRQAKSNWHGPVAALPKANPGDGFQVLVETFKPAVFTPYKVNFHSVFWNWIEDSEISVHLTDCWGGDDTNWVHIFVRCQFKIGLVSFYSFQIIFHHYLVSCSSVYEWWRKLLFSENSWLIWQGCQTLFAT